jgi:hypothetical protein
MALVGLGHHSHGGSHHGGHSHGHGGCGHHSPAAGHHAHGHGHHVPLFKGGHFALGANQFAATLLTLLSPRVAFTLLMGFGATGVLLRPWVGATWLLGALAAAGAVAFEAMLVRPLWRFLFRFASDPARMLDTVLCAEGQAVTNFDADGHGLIAVPLDGQLRQVLGTLRAEERAVGWRVRSGDRLFVRAVDPLRNRCTVSLVR